MSPHEEMTQLKDTLINELLRTFSSRQPLKRRYREAKSKGQLDIFLGKATSQQVHGDRSRPVRHMSEDHISLGEVGRYSKILEFF